MYRITQLAQRQGLSRSTLLHYDRIGLLHASDRSPSGYRIYTELEFEKRAPQAHHEFLLSLGIPEEEVLNIRTRTHPAGKP